MKETFDVIEAGIEDVEDIVVLWKKLSVDQLSKDMFYKGSFEFSTGYQQIQESLLHPDSRIYIMKSEDDILGFIEIWINRIDFLLSSDSAYIVHFYVDSHGRNRTDSLLAMHRLFQEAYKWAQRCKKKNIVADAFEHNSLIIKLLKLERMDIIKTRMVFDMRE